MYTVWLPGYPKSSFQAPCHDFQLEWGSGRTPGPVQESVTNLTLPVVLVWQTTLSLPV